MVSRHSGAFGIVIADTAVQKPNQGEVIATGSGRLLIGRKSHLLDVNASGQAPFGKYARQAVKVDVEELLVLREDAVLLSSKTMHPA